MRTLFQGLVVALVLWPASLSAVGQESSTSEQEDTKKIRAAVASYVEAFNSKDVERLVALWSDNGVYINRTSGEAIVGREAIKEEFGSMLKNADSPKLAVETESIEFISPNVALERGQAKVTFAQKEAVETNYRTVYVKHDNAWLIDRVSEDDTPKPNQRFERLRQLEWLIGDWYDESEEFTVEISCNWTKNQNFISRTYVVSVDGEVESSGLQIIGWDARKEQIQSWLFDSEGGVVTGKWSQGDDRWIVQSVASLPDGGSGSFTSVYRPLSDETYSWQKINRVVDGQLLPNIDETVIKRR